MMSKNDSGRRRATVMWLVLAMVAFAGTTIVGFSPADAAAATDADGTMGPSVFAGTAIVDGDDGTFELHRVVEIPFSWPVWSAGPVPWRTWW